MFVVRKIDHIAVAVRDIDAAASKFAACFGLKPGERENVPDQRTDTLLLPVGDSQIELIAPDGNPGLEKFLEKRGPGLHHVALEVEGLENALAFLKALGVALIDEEPRTGARGHKVAFIHPKATGGVLIELVEPLDASTHADAVQGHQASSAAE